MRLNVASHSAALQPHFPLVGDAFGLNEKHHTHPAAAEGEQVDWSDKMKRAKVEFIKHRLDRAAPVEDKHAEERHQ